MKKQSVDFLSLEVAMLRVSYIIIYSLLHFRQSVLTGQFCPWYDGVLYVHSR